MQLTVYFDGQFWVGVAEDTDYEPPLVARRVFGAEPQDAEVLRFVNRELLALLAESTLSGPRTHTNITAGSALAANPKRRAREAAAVLRQHGVSTKAQAALQEQYEARKQERVSRSRDEREAELERKWQLKRERAKAQHRGR